MPEQADKIDSTSPGEILKRCREFQGLSLEAAAEATKIGAEYLRALEENKCEQFASLAYLKGFVRIYATSLGLDPDDIIRLYSRQYALEDPHKDHQEHKHLASKRKTSKKFPLQKLYLPIILLVLLLITAMFINRFSPFKDNQAAAPHLNVPINNPSIVQQPISSVPPLAIKPQENKPKEDTEKISDTSETKLQPKTEAVGEEAAKGFVVSLKALKNCSLLVTVDTGASQQHDLTAGDHIEWQGKGVIALELSEAGAVELSCNGKQIALSNEEGVNTSIVFRENCLN